MGEDALEHCNACHPWKKKLVVTIQETWRNKTFVESELLFYSCMCACIVVCSYFSTICSCYHCCCCCYRGHIKLLVLLLRLLSLCKSTCFKWTRNMLRCEQNWFTIWNNAIAVVDVVVAQVAAAIALSVLRYACAQATKQIGEDAFFTCNACPH